MLDDDHAIELHNSTATEEHLNIEKSLGISIALNAIIFIVEFVGGILTNSLALISDSLHNLSDFFALILSYIASRVVQWKSNSEKSYGYVRIEIFVAFINSMALVLIGMYVISEGIQRFAHPEPVAGGWMLIIAIVGFVVNTAATLLLKTHAHHDLNMKSAYLHLFTDALESLAVVVIAGLIAWKNWRFLDPLISIAIGLFIIKSAWSIVAETVHILTEGTPRGIDLQEVAAFILVFSRGQECSSFAHLGIVFQSAGIKCSYCCAGSNDQCRKYNQFTVRTRIGTSFWH